MAKAQSKQTKKGEGESDSTAPKVILSSRHVIDTSAPAEPTAETEDTKPAPISMASTKPKVIVPISDVTTSKGSKPATAPELSTPSASTPEKEEQPDQTEVETADAPIEETKEQSKEAEEAEPATPQPSESPEENKTTEGSEPKTQLNGSEETSEVVTENKEDKPNKDTEKALKEAEEAAEKNKKLEESIEKREYFVPINAVAQKRSIKASALMTLAVFLLALVLIDLMLDTGSILLIQKVPHTHFFTTSSNN